MMERGEPAWTTDLRSAWTRFILTLLLRMPEDVIALKGLAESYLIHGDDIEIKYRQLRSNDDPTSWTKWLETNAPNVIESAKFRIARSLMNHEKIGTDINNLTWSLVNTNQCRFEMLTSDRPVTMSSNMALEDAFILVPVGPRRFFLACRKGPSIDAKMAESVVTNSNKYVVTRAVKFVYGTSPSAPLRREKYGNRPRGKDPGAPS